MLTRRRMPGAPGRSGEGWSSRLSGAFVRRAAARGDTRERQARDRRIIRMKLDDWCREKCDAKGQIRGRPDRRLKQRMPVICRAGEGRDRRERVVLVTRGYRRLLMIRGKIDVREGMPDLPGWLPRARKQKEAEGDAAKQTRSWHGTTISP